MNDDRYEMMRHHGVTRCPAWCAQPDDEEQEEAHQSADVYYETSERQTVRIRLYAGWWDGTDDELVVTTALNEYGELRMSIDDWRQISAIGDELVGRYDQGGQQWAYPGADLDEAGIGADDDEDDDG